MSSPPLLVGTDGTIEPEKPEAGPNAPGVLVILLLSAWCGTLAGLLEVGAFAVRKRFFDENRLLGVSRHYLWMIPLTDLLILGMIGAGGCLLIRLRPKRGRWAVARILAALTMLPPLLTFFPTIYGLAWLLLTVGASMRLVPLIERRRSDFRRVVVATAPALAGVLVILAMFPGASDWRKQRSEQSRPIPVRAPNILLIVMDTVAADHLDLYGYGRPTSQAIDEMARGGCRFDAAVSAAPWTLPSHASFFTGRWPHELSVGWRSPLDEAQPTVAGYLGSRGYATAGFVANMSYCASDSGLVRGFTVYQDHVFRGLSPLRMAAMVDRSLDAFQSIGEAVGDALDLEWLRASVLRVREAFESDHKEAAEVNREFLDWLSDRAGPDRPYFAFLNYIDAHSPYQLLPRRIHRFGHRPSDEREFRLIRQWWDMDKTQVTPEELALLVDAYDDCVASIDEQVGRLLDQLGRRGALEKTWVILIADHGESFGEHEGVYLHGSSLYQTELHVPMVVLPPPGTRIQPVVTETVSLRDLAATIAEIAGLDNGSPFPGTSMVRLWRPTPRRKRADDPREPSLAELVPNETLGPHVSDPTWRPSPMASMTVAGWSYIRRGGVPREELYDLARDPHEIRDLSREAVSESRLAAMRKALSRMTGGPLTPDRFPP